MNQIKSSIIITAVVTATVLTTTFFFGGEVHAEDQDLIDLQDNVPLPSACLSPRPLHPTIIVERDSDAPMLEKLYVVEAFGEIFNQPVPLSYPNAFDPCHLSGTCEPFPDPEDVYYQIRVLDYDYEDNDAWSANFTHPDTGEEYGIQNAVWIATTTGEFYQQPWWYNFCWGPVLLRKCNNKFVNLPEPNPACLEALDRCWTRYYEGPPGGYPPGSGNGPDCPTVPAPFPGESSSYYPGPFSPPFSPGTVIPPYGLGSSWDIADPPFGGRIYGVTPCLCSMTWKVWVGPPGIPGVFDWVTGMPQFAIGAMPFPSRSVLGWFTGGNACVQWSGLSCTVWPSMGIITPIVGTSAL